MSQCPSDNLKGEYTAFVLYPIGSWRKPLEFAKRQHQELIRIEVLATLDFDSKTGVAHQDEIALKLTSERFGTFAVAGHSLQSAKVADVWST